MFVRLTHRPSSIHLRSATGPTYHFGDQILKPWWRHLMVGLVYRRVGIEPGICHDPVDKIVDHARNAIPSRPYRLGFCGSAGIVRTAKSEANTFPCRAERSYRFASAPTRHVVAFLTRRLVTSEPSRRSKLQQRQCRRKRRRTQMVFEPELRRWEASETDSRAERTTECGKRRSQHVQIEFVALC